MFFENNREQLRKVIHLLQRSICHYDRWGINQESKPPSFCDCKYGFDEKEHKNKSSEQNGCPELRNVEHILSVMTDNEYKMFLDRKASDIIGEIN